MLWKRFFLSKSPSPPTCPLPNNVTLFRKRPRSLRSCDLAIAATGIDMVYQTGSQTFQALKGVDIAVPTGVMQMVVGPSGAGKTTLLLILAGLLTPTQGQIHLLGQDVTQYSRRQLDRFRLKNIGILFQESNLLRSLTALENVTATLSLKGIHGRAAQQEAHRLLAAVGLDDRAHHLPRQLSGGQQQRVAIARALAGNPALLIADEPTAALDSANGHRVVESMRQLAKEQGSTVLIATHDPRILNFADRIAHLNDGVLQPPESLS
ncbi:MAG: ABC transporter ATP-binding protein [Synechococcales bacterium]|nr:ABC transporter ATP-binding protein [Synechococcales bacterium]